MSNNTITVGTGPIRVLALHGWFGSAASWRPLAEVVDTTRFSYAFMDYRGYGGARHLRGDFSIAEIAADALAVADRLGWQRFALLGHSMGGSAIQQVLADAPARVTGLVGVAPVPASGVPFDAATWDLFASAAGNPAARRGILDFSTGSRLSAHWLDGMVAHSLEHSTAEAFAAYLPAWANTDFAARMAGNPVPVQLIVGEHDPSLTEGVMRETWLRWYPNAQLQVLRNAGHYPMNETPVALATAIETFLSSLTALA